MQRAFYFIKVKPWIMATLTSDPFIIQGLPTICTFSDISKDEFIAWYATNANLVDELITKTGGILFRGIAMADLPDFEMVTDKLFNKFISYIDGFSPRTKLSKSIYTSTEYDSDFRITLHNELSFSHIWPSKLLFFCVTPAREGGATTLADCRQILTKLNADLLATFEQKGVTYIRNLHNGHGLGPSWQQTYETDDKARVEQFCKSGGTEFSWGADGSLHLVQHKPAVIRHRQTGERVWFNQVDQFHPSQLNKEIHDILMELYNDNEMLLPMYGCFGDGSRISQEQIDLLHDGIDACCVPVQWEKGDLLIVDNETLAHGRMPYKGNRKILVSMTQ
jgi:alpha-ketoglutarate-dependent taurine dioxygenase